VSQQLEIEFKNLLTIDEFNRLVQAFSLSKDEFLEQINYYLDSPDFALRNNKCALRIREKNGNLKLTLKQPVTEGLLETDQFITKEDFVAITDRSQFPKGPVVTVLQDIGINLEEVQLLGELKTTRAKTFYKEGTLFFDHSEYLRKEDFELEYEVTDAKVGLLHFEELLKEYQIPKRETVNKIVRFFKEKSLKNNKS
jgi:uncharacterized protein YjbK